MMQPPHRWRVVSMDDVPAGSAWLGPRERRIEATLTMPRRRRDWRAGRWSAKALAPEQAPAEWEVIADDDGCPRVWQAGKALATPVSISHRADFAAAALSQTERRVGIDLELVEAHTERFVRDYFAPAEVERAYRQPPGLWDVYASVVWSAKEAVLKCLRLGLNRDTRTVVIDIDPAATTAQAGGWSRFIAHDRPTGHRYEGWWTKQRNLLRNEAPLILTIASGPVLE